MGTGLYSHTTRASGLTLTAAIYNADHQNHINNHNTVQMDDYSTNTAEMQTQTTPGNHSGAESAATSLSGEIERIRYVLARMRGTQYWYEDTHDIVRMEMFS